jgi:hypothetical protein
VSEEIVAKLENDKLHVLQTKNVMMAPPAMIQGSMTNRFFKYWANVIRKNSLSS